jgi:enoyl-[acyl-carrier protein] reductase II
MTASRFDGTALDTPLRRMLGIEVPIVQAGMGEGARAELVAAVSEAGGLGVLGAAALTPEQLRTEMRRIRERTDRPFGVNLIFPPEFTGEKSPLADQADQILATAAPALREELEEIIHIFEPGFVDRQVEACLEEGASTLWSGLGMPPRVVDAVHSAGGHVFGQVGSVKQAQRVVDAGVDGVVASGSDAGGHTGYVGSLSLWAAVVDAVDVPVLASGGVSDGRTLAAALVLGCQGAWCGTRFLATAEMAVDPRAKQRVVEAGTDDTVVTRVFSGKPLRVIRNEYVDSWRERDSEILPFPLQVFAAEGRGRRGLTRGDVEGGAVQAGQGLGLIHAVESAGDVVRSMAADALACLERVAGPAPARSTSDG